MGGSRPVAHVNVMVNVRSAAEIRASDMEVSGVAAPGQLAGLGHRRALIEPHARVIEHLEHLECSLQPSPPGCFTTVRS